MNFENMMRDNMLKTRMFKIPDDIKEPQHRIFWWNEQCCILSAKEAAESLEARNGELESYKKDWQEIAGRANLKHLVADLENYIRDHGQLLIEKATLEKKLEIAVGCLSKVLKSRRCSEHAIGDCPTDDEKRIYVPIKEALAAINKREGV